MVGPESPALSHAATPQGVQDTTHVTLDVTDTGLSKLQPSCISLHVCGDREQVLMSPAEPLQSRCRLAAVCRVGPGVRRLELAVCASTGAKGGLSKKSRS